VCVVVERVRNIAREAGGASLYHMMHSSCESFNNSFTSLIYCSSDGQKPFGNSSAFDDDVGECVCVCVVKPIGNQHCADTIGTVLVPWAGHFHW